MTGKIFFLLTLVGLGPEWLEVRAAVWTVSNNPTSIAQFNSIPAAITASSPFDTIHVHGSPINYGAITVTKPLVFIGTGSWPSTGMSQNTSVTYFLLNTAAGSGSVIKGINMTDFGKSVHVTVNAVNNVTIEHCRLQGPIDMGTTATSGWNIRNNLICYGVFTVGQAPYPTATNIYLAGNLIRSEGFSNFDNWLPGSSFLVEHNIFFTSISTNTLGGLRYAIIRNNICVNGSASAMLNCEIYNNLFSAIQSQSAYQGVGSVVYDNLTNVGIGNFFIESTTFGIGLWNYTPVSPFPDLHLHAGSLALGFGYDNTDCGIYDGPHIWRDNPAGQPRIYYPGPEMPWINVLTGTMQAPPNSSIDIIVSGTNAN